MYIFRPFSILICLMPVLAGCGVSSDSTIASAPAGAGSAILNMPEEIPLPTDSSTLVFTRLKEESHQTTITCTGTVNTPPQNRVLVSVPASGFVRKIIPLPGQLIRKGSLVAELEHPVFLDLQRSYLQARSEMKFVGPEYRRQVQLVRDSVSPQRDFEEIAARYAGLQSQMALDSVELALYGIKVATLTPQKVRASIRVFAPLTGYVVAVNVHLGQLAVPDSGLVEMVDLSHLHLELDVFEQDIQHLAVGQTVRFKVPEHSTELTASLYILGQEVNPATRTLRVHAHPDEASEQLRPGAFVEARISGRRTARWTGPVAGLWQESKGTFVWLREGNRLRKMPLEDFEIEGDQFVMRTAPAWGSTHRFLIQGQEQLLP